MPTVFMKKDMLDHSASPDVEELDDSSERPAKLERKNSLFPAQSQPKIDEDSRNDVN